MSINALSIRPFIGSKDYEISRAFYRDMEFEEIIISHDMSLFRTPKIGFYLQKYYNADWVNNTMLFVEVDDVEVYYNHLLTLNLTEKYRDARIKPIRTEDWGKECFVHDPAGVLWHFGQFNTEK